MEIEKFRLIDSLKNYDKTENPDRLNVFELSPNGVSWCYGDNNHEIKSKHKLRAFLLKNKNQIAIIDDLFGKNENKAYIVNGENQKMWDVSSIFSTTYRDFITNKHVIFRDVYYIGSELNFFIIINNIDFRFEFNLQSGKIGKLIETR